MRLPGRAVALGAVGTFLVSWAFSACLSPTLPLPPPGQPEVAVLSADGKSVFDRASVEQPNGNGNPDAVTCRRPVPLTASRVRFGPQVCLTNAQWKSIAEKNMVVTAMGDIVKQQHGPPADGAFPVASVNQGPPL